MLGIVVSAVLSLGDIRDPIPVFYMDKGMKEQMLASAHLPQR
jgi:hypothetical protein